MNDQICMLKKKQMINIINYGNLTKFLLILLAENGESIIRGPILE